MSDDTSLASATLYLDGKLIGPARIPDARAMYEAAFPVPEAQESVRLFAESTRKLAEAMTVAFTPIMVQLQKSVTAILAACGLLMRCPRPPWRSRYTHHVSKRYTSRDTRLTHLAENEECRDLKRHFDEAGYVNPSPALTWTEARKKWHRRKR